MEDETSPLLPHHRDDDGSDSLDGNNNVHRQFCTLVGLVPADVAQPDRRKYPRPGPNTLYERACRKRSTTQLTYAFTSSLSNSLLLSQIVLGAALTGLGASASSPLLITIFGAMNTIIAGVVAYLKSRGQPMRSRMFRDDLERVVDEIENSEVMWLGISKHMHGYDDIDTEDDVSVRAEVARLTRLYDRAVRNNTLNNPDMYASSSHGSEPYGSLRAHTTGSGFPAIAAATLPTVDAAAIAGPGAAPEMQKDPPPKSEATSPAPAPETGEASGFKADAASVNLKDKDVPAKTASSKTPAGTAKTDIPDSPTTNGNPLVDGASSNSPQKSPNPAPTQIPVTNPAPVPAPAPAEPPAGVPLAADVDEGPVTAPVKKKDKVNDDKPDQKRES